MRYLITSADYLNPSLRDEAHGELGLAELRLPEDLSERIVEWNEKYQPILHRDEAERSVDSTLALISELDIEGLSLSAEIAAAVDGGAKVSYYSEGLLERIPLRSPFETESDRANCGHE